MSKDTIDDPAVYFGDLGGLHDAVITGFSWSQTEQVLRIRIDDLNSGFLDLPEYQGLRPVELVFIGVHYLDCNTQISASSCSIYAMDIEKEEFYEVNIKCSPGGCFTCKCDMIKLVDI